MKTWNRVYKHSLPEDFANTGCVNADSSLTRPHWRTGEESRKVPLLQEGLKSIQQEWRLCHRKSEQEMWLWCWELFLCYLSVMASPQGRISPAFMFVLSRRGPHSKWCPHSIPISSLSYLFLIKAYPVCQDLCVYSDKVFTAEAGYVTNTLSHRLFSPHLCVDWDSWTLCQIVHTCCPLTPLCPIPKVTLLAECPLLLWVLFECPPNWSPLSMTK